MAFGQGRVRTDDTDLFCFVGGDTSILDPVQDGMERPSIVGITFRVVGCDGEQVSAELLTRCTTPVGCNGRPYQPDVPV